MSATHTQTGDVTIPAIVVEASGGQGWLSIEWHRDGWSAEVRVEEDEGGYLVDAVGATWQEAIDALAEVLRGETT